MPDDEEIIGAPPPRPSAPIPVTSTSASPSATSILRAAGSTVSQKQISIVAALIISTATGVALFLVTLFGNQIDDINESHGREISRLEASVTACEERAEADELRAEARCDDRIQDLKDNFGPIQQSLRQCLERDIQVTIENPD